MSECDCNGSFRSAEDYRDHLPCPGVKQKANSPIRKRLLEALETAVYQAVEKEALWGLQVERDGLRAICVELRAERDYAQKYVVVRVRGDDGEMVVVRSPVGTNYETPAALLTALAAAEAAWKIAQEIPF